MLRFAANLSFLYNEYPFLERFAAAAADGFQGVEYLFPYAYPAQQLRDALQAQGLQQVLFNAPAGGSTLADMSTAWERGERGTACLPGREEEFRAGIQHALQYAAVLQCPRIHVMAGLVPAEVDTALLHSTYVSNLRWAAREAAAQGCEVLIEPINPRDMPGYYLNRQDHAHAVRHEVAQPALKVQMDLYHCHIVEGDVPNKLRLYLPTQTVAHVQIASVPHRNEPDSGELDYAQVFQLLDALGYGGWIGCEYRPRAAPQKGATRAGLGWLPNKGTAVA